MINPSIDQLLSKVESKFLLVNLVSKRVKQIEKNGYYQMKEKDYKSKQEIGRALEEISEGLIHIKTN